MFRQFCCGLRASALTLIVLSAAACHSLVSDQRGGFVIPPDLGLNNLMALPQPFHTDHKDLPLALTSMGRSDVAVPPIAGLSIANNYAIKTALTQAADGADILMLRDMPDRPTYVLEGIAKQSSGTLSISWYLRDPKTHLVKAFEVSTELSGAPGSIIGSRDARDLAGQTVAVLSSALASTGGVMTVPPQRSSTAGAPPKIYIGAVTGAPGDGNRSLPAALRSVLSEDGAPLTGDASKADYTLAAKVATDSPQNGKQSIAITWQVIDRKGVVAGQITQSNEIKAGSLDGDWGQTAFDIALAAEGGLGDMLNEIEARQTGLAEDDPNAGPVIPDVLLQQHTLPAPTTPAPAVEKSPSP